MSRYARQEQLIGTEGQARLAAARVLVVGAGGLAAPVLPLLAGAGVGQISVIDPDHVALSNLHRQTLFCEEDLGQPKAEVAQRALQARNSTVKVVAKVGALTPLNAPDLVAAADLVLDCADSFAVSYALSDSCAAAGRPLVTASVLGVGGYAAGVCGGAPSLRAVFPEPPENGASCASAGVMGPVVAMVGALQAQMALAVLLGQQPSPLGQMVQIDGAGWRSSQWRFDGAPEPEEKFAFVAPAQIRPDDLVIDLRRDAAPEGFSACQRVALVCDSGLRAWRAAAEIRARGASDVVLVAARGFGHDV